MTETVCTTAPGELSNEMLDSANRLIDAWAHMDSKECAIKVENLLKRLVDERYAGNLQAKITLSDYNLLLEGWARSRTGIAGAERCEEILSQLQQHPEISPDRKSFKTVLKAWRWSKNKNAAVRAQEVLEEMIQVFISKNDFSVCPDAECFNIVLSLWSRSGAIDATQRTEQLVLVMERLNHATGIEGLAPTTKSLNEVITAWSRLSDQSAMKNALEIVRFMKKNAKAGNTSMKPDRNTYSTCIGIIARMKGSALLAEKMLNKIEELAREKADGRYLPDRITYNSVISCWAHENTANSFQRARRVLDRQIHSSTGPGSDCIPDVYGFTAVLAACAMEPKKKSEAFQMASDTFDELQKFQNYGSPNHVTYGTMLKCCAKLLSPTNPLRKKMTEKIMTQCIENGCVGEMVMGRFREAATPDLFGKLMRGVDKKKLPVMWTKNLPDDGGGRKKKSRKQKKIKFERRS